VAVAAGQALRGRRKFVLSILGEGKLLVLRRALVSTFRANREVQPALLARFWCVVEHRGFVAPAPNKAPNKGPPNTQKTPSRP
jgi:hypothetical protein